MIYTLCFMLTINKTLAKKKIKFPLCNKTDCYFVRLSLMLGINKHNTWSDYSLMKNLWVVWASLVFINIDPSEFIRFHEYKIGKEKKN